MTYSPHQKKQTMKVARTRLNITKTTFIRRIKKTGLYIYGIRVTACVIHIVFCRNEFSIKRAPVGLIDCMIKGLDSSLCVLNLIQKFNPT